MKGNMVQKRLIALLLACLASATISLAQESNALLDALVKKKILTVQEAEEIRADLVREQAATSAGKIALSSAVTSLKLSGDIRVRYQYDNDRRETGDAGDTQRSRERVRLRLSADLQLVEGWFAGLQLQTGQQSNSGNQTMGEGSAAGFGNYGIYLSRVFLGWSNEDMTFVAGKMANPFFTTNMVWKSDINPSGFAQSLDLMKLFGCQSPVGLKLVAGQFVAADNAENATADIGNLDSWLFQGQLIASAKLGEGIKATVAPGYMTYNSGKLIANGNNGVIFEGKDANRNLSIILAPGDVAFQCFGIPAKVMWDFAYNTQAKARVNETYGFHDNGNSIYRSRDAIAWLIGFQLGANKTQGDLAFLANYRQVGMGALDPNIGDVDFHQQRLNCKGFELMASYNITDACVFALTAFLSEHLRDAGKITSPVPGATGVIRNKRSEVIRADISIKF